MHQANPYGVLVRLQDALTSSAQGESARLESETHSDHDLCLASSRSCLRQAIRQFKEVDQELAIALRREYRSPAGKRSGLTIQELESLRRNVAIELARSLRRQAASYPPHSSDHSSALTQAIQSLNSVADLEVADPLVWQCRIDRVMCLRLLGDYPLAARRLDELFAGNPPSDVARAGRLERIRLHLAAQRLQEALEELAGEDDPEFLILAADGLLHCERLDDALVVYDRAADQSRRTGDAARAFQAAFAAAGIEQKRHRHPEASQRFRRLSIDAAEHPRASEAHLLAVYHAAETARNCAHEMRPAALDDYAALIDEHVAHWPDSPTAGKACYWLGNLRAAQRRFGEALHAYEMIPSLQPEHQAAVSAAVQCCEQWSWQLIREGKLQDAQRIGERLDRFRQRAGNERRETAKE
jgi:tetratricopeptide (TPR) repeat protein